MLIKESGKYNCSLIKEKLMINNIEKYISDWFIDLKTEKMPVSFYIIRKSLLEAVNELKPIIKGRVLDLACGVMPYKQYLMNDEVIDYIGIDLEPTEYHHDVKPDFYWDGTTIPLENASVDFVIATEFLEHYFDTSVILKEIKRVLRPGGIFFFTVPCIWPLHEVPYDYHRFTPFALEEHFKKVKFSTIDIKALGGFHYYLALTLAIWKENKVPSAKQKFISPFLNLVIKILVRKDDKKEGFINGRLYSGLYGFVTK